MSRHAPVRVVAALAAHDGRVLVCQRRRDAEFPLQWEFPGGKMESAETPEEALRRELREELDVEARIGRQCFRIVHRYLQPRRTVELLFFTVSLDPACITNRAFEQVLWAAPAELARLDFLEADRALVEALASGRLILA